MHHNHQPWRPSPARKPTHLTSNTGSSASQSAAALKGATTAFATNSKPALPNVDQVRNQYEPSKPLAGAQYGARGRSPGNQDGATINKLVRRSPSRGRHLKPQDVILAGARSAASASKAPASGLQDSTSSMIAARMVSASPSPVRNGSTAGTEQRERTSPIANPNSLYGSLGSEKARSSSRVTPAPARIPRTQNATLNLDLVPRLAPKRTNTMSAIPIHDPEVFEISNAVRLPAPESKTSVEKPDSRTVLSPQIVPGTSEKLKPLAPAPRKGRPIVRSPMRADLTGPKQSPGISREEAINRMADAMVASSLASTRPSSPTKAGQSHSLRRSLSAHDIYSASKADPLKLPAKHRAQRPMKQTLRKVSPEDDDESIEITKRGRRHLVRKHPNMHHEGDRKRWRDKVTESERRRYEGVFAANRGLLLKSPDPRASPSRLVDPGSQSNQVANIVVRDIWERSRLPASVLEQIYDLVALPSSDVLNREQFVVGLWLVDQKLKGRKLPIRISESVWASVRHAQGIKVGSQKRH